MSVGQVCDFDVHVSRGGEERYVVRADAPDLLDGSRVEIPPVSREERERITALLRRSPLLRAEPDDERRQAAVVGEELYRWLLGGEIGGSFHVARRLAEDRGKALRLRLRLGEVPELAALPWELMRRSATGLPLAIASPTPVVRFLDLGEPIPRLAVPPPLRVLLAAASPDDRCALAVGKECRAIEQALDPLVAAAMVEVDTLPESRLDPLVDRLHRGRFHVLHFIGHGIDDPETGRPHLVFHDTARGGREVDAQQVAALVQGQSSLRLVVLNACHGATVAAEDTFSGIAQQLVRSRIPAVVAMQRELSDRAAIRFARHLYEELARGATIEGAVTRARRYLYFDELLGAEWASPVLFTRAPDGVLIEPATSATEPAPSDRGDSAPSASDLTAAIPLSLLSTPAPSPPSSAAASSSASPSSRPAAFNAGSDSPASGPPLAGSPAARTLRRAALLLPIAAAAAGLFWLVPLLPVPNPPGCPSPPGLSIPLARIEAGSFWMGSADGPDDERERHRVTISRSFCIGRHEVSQQLWTAVMGEDANPSNHRGPQFPVEGVSRRDTMGFIGKLNALAGREVWRLPTEAEWEYAARAGTETAYSFGDDPAKLHLYGNCRNAGDGHDGTAKVGSLRPNRWGLHDVYGNVAEWVTDWYAEGYPAGEAVDPRGPATGSERVRRGGSFENAPENCRSASRASMSPNRRQETSGLRLVRQVEEASPPTDPEPR